MTKRLLPLLLIIGLTLLFFHQMAFTDKILARGDTYNYFYPYWDVRNEAYRAGELPLWTPDIFMGAPLLANPQLGTYYPPNWLTAPFRAPNAIKISILLHALIAGVGMLTLFRTTVSERLIPALTASVIFAFGGYVGAHVEQINQLQGLAWMPWLFLLYHRLLTGQHPLRYGLIMGMVWALQIFSGHTQTVFMTGVGLGLYGLYVSIVQWWTDRHIIRIPRAFVLLALTAIIAVLLAIPQLLPTLELTGMSNRGGGFNIQQATAFSLSPNTIGRALLPSYDSQLFGEYVTYLGVIGLGLAIWGMVAKPLTPTPYPKWGWILLAVVGLMLAFGRFNPLYLILAELPGFNLFRVPARWLSLFTLGMAMLAGMGVHALLPVNKLKEQQIQSRRIAVFLLIAIGALIVLTRFVLEIDPRDIYGDPIPQDSSVMLWGLSLLVVVGLLVVQGKWTAYIACSVVILELFLASLILPYNDLTPPEVYLGQRFTISQLLARQEDTIVPGRVLAISRQFFDPGDIDALRERYNRLGLDEQSQFHAFDAVKKQELLMPNLPMTWGIPSVDGFGGGILPTIYYSQFTSLLLPENELRTVDGRLGEMLAKPECRGACIPDIDPMLLTDMRYIITDKVYDVWHDDVGYDTTLAEYWQTTRSLIEPNFVYDEVRILHVNPFDGLDSEITSEGLHITITDWQTFDTLLDDEHSILAVTLVDSRTDDVFWQLTPPPLQRMLSSDVKIYELPMPMSLRAMIANEIVALPDDWQGHEDALPILKETTMNVIHGDIEPYAYPSEPMDSLFQAVEFVEYGDTRIVLTVDYDKDAYLILNDAYYPGWTATVNGEPTPVYRANTMFRAVHVPAGESRVIFTFTPDLWRNALLVGVGIWVLLGAGLVILWRRNNTRVES